MKIAEFFQNKKIKWVMIGLGALAVLLLVFQLGLYVGYRKATFTFRWGDSYHRVFGGPKEGFLRNFGGRELINGHGTVGDILSITGQSMVIKGPDNVEKVVSISDSTVIRKGWQNLKFTDLKVGDRVVVIGSPKDDGSVSANFIRVFDSDQAIGIGPRPVPVPEKPFFPY